MNPKHCLIHSHKQEVGRGLASHSHRPEDGDLKVLAQARECGCHRNGKRQESQAWGHLDFVSHHHSKHDIISLEGNRISWLPEWGVTVLDRLVGPP